MSWKVLTGIFFAALLVAGGYFYFARINTKAFPLKLVAACDLRKEPCKAADEFGRTISFSISPANIPLMQALTPQVQVENFPTIQSIQLLIEGVNMYMGYQTVALKEAQSHNWQGKLVLPICSTTTMQWQATLTLSTVDGNFQAKFPFTTTR